jgi:hypothetical protein
MVLVGCGVSQYQLTSTVEDEIIAYKQVVKFAIYFANNI